MGFGEAVRTCFSKYGTFSGRASRSEFWWFYLFCVLVNLVLYIPVLLLGTAMTGPDSPSGAIVALWWIILIAWIILLLVLIVPQLSVGCRRLHDRGMSGWLQLLMVVPCGSIVLLIFWLMDSTPGDNQYGAPVKRA